MTHEPRVPASPISAPHDVGGAPTAEPLDRQEREPEDWERLADAIHQAMVAKGLRHHDELRRVIESLDAATYNRLTYFERRAVASEILLEEKGLLRREEIDRRASGADQWR